MCAGDRRASPFRSRTTKIVLSTGSGPVHLAQLLLFSFTDTIGCMRWLVESRSFPERRVHFGGTVQIHSPGADQIRQSAIGFRHLIHAAHGGARCIQRVRDVERRGFYTPAISPRLDRRQSSANGAVSAAPSRAPSASEDRAHPTRAPIGPVNDSSCARARFSPSTSSAERTVPTPQAPGWRADRRRAEPPAGSLKRPAARRPTTGHAPWCVSKESHEKNADQRNSAGRVASRNG